MKNTIINDNYVSNQLSKMHNIKDMSKEYKRYVKFLKYNYIRHFEFNNQKDINILDIGCGLGETLYAFKKLGYNSIRGIDISIECVEFCKKNGFDVEQGDIEKWLNNHKDEFDVILLNDLIEHVNKEQLENVLRCIYSALKENGKVFIKTINAANAILGFEARYMDLTHTICFDEYSIKQLLILGGFEDKNSVVKASNLYVFFVNPLNYIAWGMNSLINLFIRGYFILNNKRNKIFTKNLIAIGRK